MSLKGKLSRLKKDMGITEAAKEGSKPAPIQADVPFLNKWTELDAKPVEVDDSYIMLREKTFPLSTKHGRYSFEELHGVVKNWNKMASKHPIATDGRQARDLLFFDTETMGLSSGAGNCIFLLGYSQVLSDRVTVKQFFLPGPEHEAALYYQFLTDVKDFSNLVTYNGKAFDWPQVKTRHTFVRNEVPKLPAFGHFDLLHGARRLWKKELPSCKLSIVEKEILGYHRVEDTPGYLAPMLYFDFLHEPDPDYIEGVLTHNEWDVLSLITLYIHMSKLLQDHVGETLSAGELFEVAKWYEHIGELDIALAGYEKVVQIENSYSQEAILPLAKLYKKKAMFSEMTSLLEQAIATYSFPIIQWYIELAMIYEHQYKDFEKALVYSKLAQECNATCTKLSNQEKESFEIKKRIQRLSNKCHNG
ncbi:ribonuclease H-like domain-containing protein [Bacillus alkalicellulosilyticus]|uniref:ribonuclease H-like domain-containing protein n=1 Tax=Alkalihalobacterium alkalicellulosilyticum TaxID=1912214 RepID=UPI000998A95C|nr:ribonuclease H-like domain-containing protein [Bacillus alkalicellulosilyticus]